jgi:N-acetylglutamate synthase-like GNAT family acetyltransferase
VNEAAYLRAARDGDFAAIAAVINAAAEAYRGVIPPECWHEPYMADDALAAEIAAGVRFTVVEDAGEAVAVMGIQARGEVVLIRHAYVQPAAQRYGHGARLLGHLVAGTDRPVLIGTWAAAHWAVNFYRRHGFRVITGAEKDALLARYWTVPARQAAHSVVLADARF